MRFLVAVRRISSEQTVALFRSQEMTEEHAAKEVSLARSSGGCLTPIGTPNDHDHHAPCWYDTDNAECPEPKLVANLPTYIKRVCDDVIAAVGEPKSTAYHEVDDVGMVAEKGQKAKSLAACIETALETESHSAVVLTW